MSRALDSKETAFFENLCQDIEHWIAQPWAKDGSGGPYYKADARGLRGFLAELRRHPYVEEFEGKVYLYFDAFAQYGDELPLEAGCICFKSLEEPYLPVYTSHRKMIFLYWYLCTKRGYEFRLITSTIPDRTPGGRYAQRGGSISAFFVKMP